MAAILTSYPENTLVPVNSCVQLCFLDEILQPDDGTPTSIKITTEHLGLLTIDSLICLNGVTFTFGSDTDIGANEIFYVENNITVLASEISSMILQHSSLEIASSIEDETGLEFFLKNCNDSAEIVLKQLQENGEEHPDVTINADPTPVQLVENYSLKIYPFCNDELICELKEGISIYPKFETDCEGCSILSHELKRDFSPYLTECVHTPLPTFDSQILPRPTRISEFSFKWAASYGSPVNQYGTSYIPFKAIQIINYKRQQDDWNAIDRKSFEYPEQESFSLYEDYDNVCVTQNNWIHLHVERGINITASIIVNSAGVLISVLSVTDAGIFEIPTGLPQVQSILESAGIDICDIDSYLFRVRLVPDRGTAKTIDINYNVKCKGCCTSEFIFLNSMGQFDSIHLHCPDLSEMEIIRSFCASCNPCQSATTTTKNKINSIECSEIINCNFLKHSHYNERIINEFICSSEVYYCADEKLYAIEPDTSKITTYRRNSNVENTYSFRLRNFNTLIQ